MSGGTRFLRGRESLPHGVASRRIVPGRDPVLAYANRRRLQFKFVHLPRRAHLLARPMPHSSATPLRLSSGAYRNFSGLSVDVRLMTLVLFSRQDVDCSFGFDRESVVCQENKCKCANGFYERSENICRRILFSE